MQTLENQGLRAELDESTEPLSAKIKVAQLTRIPWMIVVGQKEMESQTLTLRYVSGKQEFGLTLESVLEKAKSLQSDLR